MAKTDKKSCNHCNKAFSSKNPRKIYCSNGCKVKSWRKKNGIPEPFPVKSKTNRKPKTTASSKVKTQQTASGQKKTVADKVKAKQPKAVVTQAKTEATQTVKPVAEQTLPAVISAKQELAPQIKTKTQEEVAPTRDLLEPKTKRKEPFYDPKPKEIDRQMELLEAYLDFDQELIKPKKLVKWLSKAADLNDDILYPELVAAYNSVVEALNEESTGIFYCVKVKKINEISRWYEELIEEYECGNEE